MDKKALAILIASAVLFLGGGLFWYGTQREITPPAPPAPSLPASPSPSTEDPYEKLRDIQVPEEKSETPKDVAKPVETAPAAVGRDEKFRQFTLEAKGNAFTPNKIIVNQGDSVRIDLTAVDRNYDFTQDDYGIKSAVKRGETKSVYFGATAAGEFVFYCSICGGPDKGARGTITVVPR